MTPDDARPLRQALRANAAFSIACSALLVLRPALVAEWLGLGAPLVLQTIGAGLFVFGADLWHQAAGRRIATWRALYASAADFVWVAATIVGLTLFPGAFSITGVALVVFVAILVSLFGGWQFWAIGRAHRAPVEGLYRHCIRVAVDADPHAMWSAIGRLDRIADYSPSLRRSELVDGRPPGIGAVRVCEDHAGRRWAEECIDFQDSRSFEVRFLAEAPDFPFPAGAMRGGWEVVGVENGSQVVVRWELEPKPWFLAPIILALLAYRADRELPEVIRRMIGDVAEHPDALGARYAGPAARLLPNSC